MDEVIGPPSPIITEISEDFESGLPDISEGWSYYSSTSQGRIQVVDGRLRMDDTTYDGVYTLNEAILHFDYTGMTTATLTLDHWNKNELYSENNPIDESFTGHDNGDGIALSVDNYNWVKVTNLTGSFTAQTFDLTDEIAAAAGGGAVSDVYIKFQQFDNMYVDPTGAGGDGREFDNILVVLTKPGEPDPEMNCVIGTGANYSAYNYPAAGQTTVYLGQNLPGEFDDEDQFEDGWYVAGGNIYQVISSTGYYLDFDEVVVLGNATDVGGSYILYDDDWNSSLSPKKTLEYYPTLDDGMFDCAYIYPEYLPEDRDVIPFDRNLQNIISIGSWDDERDKFSSADFWHVFLLSSYQAQSSKDLDPEVEIGAAGGGNDSVNSGRIYLETIRDMGSTWSEEVCMAHETGHTSGLEHCSNTQCIMWEGALAETVFCDECIAEMREESNW